MSPEGAGHRREQPSNRPLRSAHRALHLSDLIFLIMATIDWRLRPLLLPEKTAAGEDREPSAAASSGVGSAAELHAASASIILSRATPKTLKRRRSCPDGWRAEAVPTLSP